MFFIPLYTFILGMVLTNFYFLCLFSTNWKPDLPIFDHLPDTYYKYMMMYLVLGFFQGIAAIAGHELLHDKRAINKIIGSIPYAQFCYSHFWDEHTKGHHKYIATP